MHKRVTILILIAALFLLSGCGDSGGSADRGVSPAESPSEIPESEGPEANPASDFSYRFMEFPYSKTKVFSDIVILGYKGISETVRIPERINGKPVRGISSNAFDQSMFETVITEVHMPDGLIYIGSTAFALCDGLTTIEIPDSVTEIGTYAFYGCDNLTSITIPDSVTLIGREAFYAIPNLEITYKGKTYTSVLGNYDQYDMPKEFYDAANAE